MGKKESNPPPPDNEFLKEGDKESRVRQNSDEQIATEVEQAANVFNNALSRAGNAGLEVKLNIIDATTMADKATVMYVTVDVMEKGKKYPTCDCEVDEKGFHQFRCASNPIYNPNLKKQCKKAIIEKERQEVLK